MASLPISFGLGVIGWFCFDPRCFWSFSFGPRCFWLVIWLVLMGDRLHCGVAGLSGEEFLLKVGTLLWNVN
jgi:hypothetical protein